MGRGRKGKGDDAEKGFNGGRCTVTLEGGGLAATASLGGLSPAVIAASHKLKQPTCTQVFKVSTEQR